MDLVSQTILKNIDNYLETKNLEETPRAHLGASLIGQACSRKTWYGFRWAKKEKFNGKTLRLFNRGHLEEARFYNYLRAIGFVVHECDENGKQFSISDVNGHMGGSTDGICYFPDYFEPLLPPGAINEPVLLEAKTHGDKSYKELVKIGMKKAKPQHWSQICTYGYKMDIFLFLYMAVNKNTDELYFEFGQIDQEHGKSCIELANMVINSPDPPPKQFGQGHPECKYCNFKGICHLSEQMEKNCRSCYACTPVENKEWFCQIHNSIIPKEFIPKGCENWKAVDGWKNVDV